MYTGDPRGPHIYTAYDFYITSAHEFGHSLGLGDVYTDDKLKNKIISVMNNQWEARGKAQPVDYAMLLGNLKNPNMVKYSSRMDIVNDFLIN